MNREIVPQLLPEEQLTVLAARISLDSVDESLMESIFRHDLDWSRVMKCSERLRVAPLLYKHLSEDRYITHVPREVMLWFEDAYHRQSIKNLRAYGQLSQFLEATASRNIPIILLKGIFLAKWIYGDIALRPFNDIDLLCRQEDVHIIKNALFELGYYQDTVYQSPLHEKIAVGRSVHLPPFIHPKAAARIEVHVSIFPPFAHDSRNIEGVFKRAIVSDFDGLPVYFLSPEDQIIFLSLHLYRHVINSGHAVLSWFCDIHEFIKYYQGQIDWHLVRSYRDALGIGTYMEPIFNLLKENWNTPIPQYILEFSGKRKAQRLHLGEIIQEDSFRCLNKASNFLIYRATLKEIKDSAGWSSCLYYLWRTLFPSRNYLMHHYHLSSPFMFYPYSAIHILRRLHKLSSCLIHYILLLVTWPDQELRDFYRWAGKASGVAGKARLPPDKKDSPRESGEV